MHNKENKTNINIEGIPHKETNNTVIILIGITTLSGTANLL